MEAAILFVLGGLFTLLVRSLWLGMLKNCGLVALNYQQKEIPVSSGPLFLGSTTFALWLGSWWGSLLFLTVFPFYFSWQLWCCWALLTTALEGRMPRAFAATSAAFSAANSQLAA